jgi:hypothetical protein
LLLKFNPDKFGNRLTDMADNGFVEDIFVILFLKFDEAVIYNVL